MNSNHHPSTSSIESYLKNSFENLKPYLNLNVFLTLSSGLPRGYSTRVKGDTNYSM